MRLFRWLALPLALALVAAACGRSETKSSGTKDTTTSAGDSKAAGGDFGDLQGVCQGGSPTGSPAQGVTPSEIRIATFDDHGFVGRPGLIQELGDTADAFAGWCNAAGGINGRTVVVDHRDSALTNVKARMTESCQQDFFMVGGGAVFDQDGVETRLECMLPDIAGFVVSPKARASELVVQPVPNSIETLPIGDLVYLAKKFPDATKHYGVLTGDIVTTKVTAAQYKEAADALGWKNVYNDLYPAAGVTDWTPFAQGLKSAGVKGLIWVGEPENLASVMKALNNIGYELDFVRTDANHYDKSLVDLAGSALKHSVYIRSVFFPFEDAKKGNATQQYLDAFAQYKPGGKARTYLGLQAWSAWLLFAESAKQCGNNLTRKCVYANAKKVKEWTGGGLHAKQDLTTGQASACFAIEQATPNGFELVADAKPNDGIFSCNPKNVYTLTGDYGKGVTLADVGQTMSNLK